MKKLLVFCYIILPLLTVSSLVNTAFADPQPIFDLTFTPDRVITFDNLTPGTILEPGDTIAPGVTFGGVTIPVFGWDFVERALVVDTGGGNLALERILVDFFGDYEGASWFSFYFDQDVTAAAGLLTEIERDDVGNPGMYGLDAETNVLLAWGFIPSQSPFYMGIEGADDPPLRYVNFSISNLSSQTIHQLDDLSIKYANPVPEPTTVDIHPDTLNKKSKGKNITCYIELPDAYSVEDIDIETVMLSVNDSSIPAELSPTETGDYNDNGIPDFMVKFDRQLVQDACGTGTVEMILTCQTYDGTNFEGSDTVLVIE